MVVNLKRILKQVDQGQLERLLKASVLLQQLQPMRAKRANLKKELRQVEKQIRRSRRRITKLCTARRRRRRGLIAKKLIVGPKKARAAAASTAVRTNGRTIEVKPRSAADYVLSVIPGGRKGIARSAIIDLVGHAGFRAESKDGSTGAVDQAIGALVARGLLRRIARGVYGRPRRRKAAAVAHAGA